jgi:hypothetical protein
LTNPTTSEIPVDSVLSFVPGEALQEELAEQLGEPNVFVDGPTGRFWVYVSKPAVPFEEAGEKEPDWLLVRFDAGGKLSQLVWSSGVSRPDEGPTDPLAPLAELLADGAVDRDGCLDLLGPPSGLLRDRESDHWVYVEGSGDEVRSHILRFSSTGSLLGCETREGADWAAEAAEEFLPDEVGIPGSGSGGPAPGSD